MGMSRKIQKRRMWREGQRRSPRISALDACRAQQRSKNALDVTLQQQSSCASNRTNNATLKLQKEHDRVVDLIGNDSDSEGPATRTRAKKKRKLRPLQDVASTPYNAPKDSKSSSRHDDKQKSHEQQIHWDESIAHSSGSTKQKGLTTCPDQLSSMPSASWLPEKRILELIIDILQRKDSHEIFAEPVDPDEVEDYFEIIKEPMDFGTMRAKLHEGMYTSLREFEHDIFLITGNAMYFNTSDTIYFRQARAIDDLAKKVFHALKTDPKNFELEISRTRRRSGRRPLQSEATNSICNSIPKLATNSRFHSRKPHSSPKCMVSSTNGSSVLRRSRLNSGCSVTATAWFDSGDHGLLFDGICTSSEADRRSSYKPQMSFLSEKHSTWSTSSSDSKLLVHVNQQDIGYCKSLMFFAKDLGPTAQMIARHKILQCSTETANLWCPGCASGAHNNCANYMASTSGKWNRPTEERTSALGYSSCSNQMEMCVSDKGKGAWPCNKTGACDSSVEVASHNKSGGNFGVLDQECDGTGMDILSVGRIGKFKQNLDDMGEGLLNSATSDARDLSLPVSELTSTDEKSTSQKPDKTKIDNESPTIYDSAPRNLWSNSSQRKLLENLSLPPSSCTGIFSRDQTIDCTDNLNLLRAQSHEISADGGTNNGVGLCERYQGLTSSEDWKPVSRFIFDLPFLKNRLDEINPVEQECVLGRRGASGRWNAIVERPFHSSLNNLDNKRTNLVLRL